MRLKMKTLPVLIAGSVALLAASVGAIYAGSHAGLSARDAALVKEGRQVFRYDTFGDEIKWTDQLRMNEVISTAVSRSEEHTSELQSLMRISYAVFCLKKKKKEN